MLRARLRSRPGSRTGHVPTSDSGPGVRLPLRGCPWAGSGAELPLSRPARSPLPPSLWPSLPPSFHSPVRPSVCPEAVFCPVSHVIGGLLCPRVAAGQESKQRGPSTRPPSALAGPGQPSTAHSLVPRPPHTLPHRFSPSWPPGACRGLALSRCVPAPAALWCVSGVLSSRSHFSKATQQVRADQGSHLAFLTVCQFTLVPFLYCFWNCFSNPDLPAAPSLPNQAQTRHREMASQAWCCRPWWEARRLSPPRGFPKPCASEGAPGALLGRGCAPHPEPVTRPVPGLPPRVGQGGSTWPGVSS